MKICYTYQIHESESSLELESIVKKLEIATRVAIKVAIKVAAI